MLCSLQLNSLDQITPAVVNGYIKLVLQRVDLKDWQIGQVIDAIRILCVGLLDRKRYEAIFWDKYQLTAKTINPDHATLARKTVFDNNGKLLFVKPRKALRQWWRPASPQRSSSY